MKMKKKILSAAVLAALGSGAAQAVNLSQDGTGQVILFPYYTVQGNEETYLQVVNTTDMGKAVKIRFREAYNSREVLDFNIYLSPYDVWTGTITDIGDGAGVRTNDTSCTVPDLDGRTIPFRDYAYADDQGPDGIERTREGYVEIIEMAEIDVESPSSVIDADGNGRADFVHVSVASTDGKKTFVPEDCSTFVKNWDPDNGAWTMDPLAGGDLSAPSGGLFGTLSIINVASGTQVSVNATALEAVYDTVQHHGTGTDLPNLASGVDQVSVVMVNDGVAVNGQGAQVYQTDWSPSGPAYWGVNAVSATMMASSIMNGYSFNPDNEAESAWVITFPTKWAYSDVTSDAAVVAPFTEAFNDDPNPLGQACEEFTFHVWNREEYDGDIPDEDVDFSPQPPGVDPTKHYLCYEVNVLQFGDSNVFSAANTKVSVTNLPDNKGWMKLMFTDAHSMGDADMSTNVEGHVFDGLPVIGFKAKVLGNGQLEGAGSYASAVDHVYERVISGGDATYSQTVYGSGAE